MVHVFGLDWSLDRALLRLVGKRVAMQGLRYRDYVTLGAAAGVVVATAYCVALDSPSWGCAICEVAGVGLGAILGALTGDGSLKEAWAGRIGAFLIPLVALALGALLITIFLASKGH